MRLELPWPPEQCFPNFKRRHHWRAYHKQCKQYREDCSWYAKTVKPTSYKLKITFHPPNRRMDDDNIVSGFKHGRDGLADGWGVNDKIFKPEYIHADPIPGGKVIIEAI